MRQQHCRVRHVTPPASFNINGRHFGNIRTCMSFLMPIVFSVISICINARTMNTDQRTCQDNENDTTLQPSTNAMHTTTPLGDIINTEEKESDYHEHINKDIVSVGLHSQYTSSAVTSKDFRLHHCTTTRALDVRGTCLHKPGIARLHTSPRLVPLHVTPCRYMVGRLLTGAYRGRPAGAIAGGRHLPRAPFRGRSPPSASYRQDFSALQPRGQPFTPHEATCPNAQT